jgi:hypothetical protein
VRLFSTPNSWDGPKKQSKQNRTEVNERQSLPGREAGTVPTTENDHSTDSVLPKVAHWECPHRLIKPSDKHTLKNWTD